MVILEYLRSRKIRFETILHAPECCSTRRARRLHVPGDRVAKAVVVRVGDSHVLTVLSATAKIDWTKLAAVLGSVDVRLASEEEIGQIFADCERGAVPPFGSLYGMPTIVDASLAGSADIVVEGNLRHMDIRLRFEDFELLESPRKARFTQPGEARRPTGWKRRAG